MCGGNFNWLGDQAQISINGDLQAVQTLLAELREAYESLPRHLQQRVRYLLRETACPGDTDSKTMRPDTSRAELGREDCLNRPIAR